MDAVAWSHEEGKVDDVTIPYLTTAQMVEVDRAMTAVYRIDLIQMMEHAGRSLAHMARGRFLGGDPPGKRLAALAGGGALVAARRLGNWGADVPVFLTKASEGMTSVTAHQLDIARRMGIPFATADGGYTSPPRGLDNTFDVILDGLIGCGLRNASQGPWRSRREISSVPCRCCSWSVSSCGSICIKKSVKAPGPDGLGEFGVSTDVMIIDIDLRHRPPPGARDHVPHPLGVMINEDLFDG